nr:ribonuclease E/G [Clostridium sp. C105KSO13]
MSRKVLMMKEENKIWMFLLENDEIVEIHCTPEGEKGNSVQALGNIYVGKVKNIVSNIGAAFIEIGNKVECYYDMSQADRAIFTRKSGKKSLCIGDELVVQITKEAVKTKAPTVSSNLSFHGHYVILTSGNTRIGTSGKLPKRLRTQLKEQLQPLKNEEYGIIVRTNAKDAAFSDIIEEIRGLETKYFEMKKIAHTRICFSCLYQEPSAYISDLKNVYTEGLTEIIIEGDELYSQVREYYEKEQPEYLVNLRRYASNQLSLAKLYSTRTVLDRTLGQRVWLKNGAYLVIQYTEALTVIDVNSGKFVAKKGPMETYLKINLEAAEEAAKQIRLRNLNGIIIIDFINLEDDNATHELLKFFRHYLSRDPIQTTLVDMTELQLVEVTRKKVRRPLHESIKE